MHSLHQKRKFHFHDSSDSSDHSSEKTTEHPQVKRKVNPCSTSVNLTFPQPVATSASFSSSDGSIDSIHTPASSASSAASSSSSSPFLTRHPPPCDRLLYVAESDLECGGRRAGLGLFTFTALQAKIYLGRYHGSKVTQKALEAKQKATNEHNAYLMDVRSERTQRLLHIIDAKGTGDDNVCKFVNTIVSDDQADQVNAMFELCWVPVGKGGRPEAQVWLRTTKAIGANTEIITDYGDSRLDIVFPKSPPSTTT